MFSSVHPPDWPSKAPTRTEAAGRKRKRIVYAKNGIVPTHASERRLRPDATSGRSAPDAASVAMITRDLRGPLLCDQRLRGGLLPQARELHLRVDRGRGQRVQQRLRKLLAPREVGEARRMSEALQPEDLTLVGVEELLPEASRPRVGRCRVDRLHVVRAVDAVTRDVDLPPGGRELGDVREVVVVPVDRDGGLARRNRLRGRLDGDVVAGLLHRREPVDARPDVLHGAAVCERRPEHTRDRRARLQGTAVERDLALVLRLRQVLPGGRWVADQILVVADRDRAPVVAVPVATRVLHRTRDRRELRREVLRVQTLPGAVNGE